MIKSVGQATSAAVEAAKLREAAQSRSSAPVSADPAPAKAAEKAATPAARMAAQGAPVDLERISRVKQAISSGQYPVDPDKIAERMIDLDLPQLRA
ncbi:MAG: flagellar biosynthesis anti-sigma factor FlgM [Alphaproteobacteria bacterium]|jgi:flagellar biosynthesis anti-sigma factor FlgM|nr:flagellar biosynthesis anti-sigma factor FlgM [Alphaproteobacteria bacterium]MBU0793295.1 flagellar biosynthesis anti-sigma factor FlgM [Alphaproteobacteria bacterium]MBU0876260.1 flagellar biosynthesis anti-sigma factor FlgM [Alphaproteobacteria bacterium]MBU1768185.1 flagellar biosynthesis anti-sigma factor FlgM [Alphaproteobacteria bacterium]